MPGNELKSTCNKNHDIIQNMNTKVSFHDDRKVITHINEEIHAMLQLPPEDLAKVDKIELKLTWRPELTVHVYPKKF